MRDPLLRVFRFPNQSDYPLSGGLVGVVAKNDPLIYHLIIDI